MRDAAREFNIIVICVVVLCYDFPLIYLENYINVLNFNFNQQTI